MIPDSLFFLTKHSRDILLAKPSHVITGSHVTDFATRHLLDIYYTNKEALAFFFSPPTSDYIIREAIKVRLCLLLWFKPEIDYISCHSRHFFAGGGSAIVDKRRAIAFARLLKKSHNAMRVSHKAHSCHWRGPQGREMIQASGGTLPSRFSLRPSSVWFNLTLVSHLFVGSTPRSHFRALCDLQKSGPFICFYPASAVAISLNRKKPKPKLVI